MPDLPVPAAGLPLTQDAMSRVALRCVEIAREKGASDSEVEVSAAVGQSVTVRRGEVETVEYNRDKGMGITVYFGKRKGSASTADPRALASFSERSSGNSPGRPGASSW